MKSREIIREITALNEKVQINFHKDSSICMIEKNSEDSAGNFPTSNNTTNIPDINQKL